VFRFRSGLHRRPIDRQYARWRSKESESNPCVAAAEVEFHRDRKQQAEDAETPSRGGRNHVRRPTNISREDIGGAIDALTVARLGRIAHTGRCPTLRARGDPRISGAVHTASVTGFRRIAIARGRTALGAGRHQHVRRAGCTLSVADFGEVAIAGRRSTFPALWVENIRRAIDAPAAACSRGITISGRCAAPDIGAHQRVRRATPKALRLPVQGCHTPATQGRHGEKEEQPQRVCGFFLGRTDLGQRRDRSSRDPVGQRRERNNEFPGARPVFGCMLPEKTVSLAARASFFGDRAVFNICPVRHASCAPIGLVQFTALPVGVGDPPRTHPGWRRRRNPGLWAETPWAYVPYPTAAIRLNCHGPIGPSHQAAGLTTVTFWA